MNKIQLSHGGLYENQDQKSPNDRNEEYFEKVKAIYRGKTHRDRQTRNSDHHRSGIQSRNTENIQSLASSIQQKSKTGKNNNDYLQKANQQTQSLKNSKLRTQSNEVSPAKFRYYPNKVERQRKFHTNIQNDRMVRRIYQIKSRQNKYIKQSKKLMQFSNEHKMMHESSVMANKKLLEKQMDQRNDKFVDRLIERVKYKQFIKPQESQRSPKCARLQESRARVALGFRGGTVQLPPMVFL